MLRRIILVLILCVILISFSSCNYSQKGFEKWSSTLSSFELTNEYFLEKDFLTNYPYKNGMFYFEHYYPWLLSNLVERSFVWLIYDEATVYQDAKQSRFNTRIDELDSFDGTEAFGFTFHLYCGFASITEKETLFPEWFTAFGFNDAIQTLVFIGFFCDQPQKDPCVELAKTDFSAFLMHYYGDWFDWEAGVGRSSSTENPN